MAQIKETSENIRISKIDLFLLIIALLLFVSVSYEICIALTMATEMGRIQSSGIFIAFLLSISAFLYLLKAVRKSNKQDIKSKFTALAIINICVSSVLIGLVTVNRPDYEPNTTNPNTKAILNKLNELKGLAYIQNVNQSDNNCCHYKEPTMINLFIPEEATKDSTCVNPFIKRLKNNPDTKIELIGRPENYTIIGTELSKGMVKSVRTSLINAGIAPERINVDYYKLWPRRPDGVQVIIKDR